MIRASLLPASLLFLLVLTACSEDAAPPEEVANPFGIDGALVELVSEDAEGALASAARPYFTGSIPTTSFENVSGVPASATGAEVDVSVASVVLEPTGPESEAFPASIEIERLVIQDLELTEGAFGSGGTTLGLEAGQVGLGWGFQAESACQPGAACTFLASGSGAGPLTMELTGDAFDAWVDIVEGGLDNSVRGSMFVEFASASDAARATLELEVEDARLFLEAARY